jgi:hypothetical protein
VREGFESKGWNYKLAWLYHRLPFLAPNTPPFPPDSLLPHHQRGTTACVDNQHIKTG